MKKYLKLSATVSPPPAIIAAAYDESGLRVRLAKMFFEAAERDGTIMKRFELSATNGRLRLYPAA